jgi:hypothetical protein
MTGRGMENAVRVWGDGWATAAEAITDADWAGTTDGMNRKPMKKNGVTRKTIKKLFRRKWKILKNNCKH